jgi:hypothetical protein
MKVAPILALLSLSSLSSLAAGCDKPEAATNNPAPSASATASAPAPAATPAPSASAPAPAASASADPSTPTKDAVASVFDPVKEPARTVKVLAGGSVALYLPEWAGTSWKVAQPDKSLGKPKEETIPGFAGPSTPAHAFTWPIKDSLKGQMHKVLLTNSAKDKPGGDKSFTLSIDVS